MILKWVEIYERLKTLPEGKLYGIPRGGSIIAGLSGRAVDTWEEADVIIDDIIDSGKTKKHCVATYNKPFWGLVDKQRENIKEWVVFPWEVGEPKKKTTSEQS